MSPLPEIIRREISQTGPMSVARYMELCLGHPEHGYYVTRDPLGAGGDFTTAPEISQLFGEMVGAWVAAVWMQIGHPPFRLVELGPGRGTLMADVKRVLKAVGALHEVWLVETSPVLRARQAAEVADAHWAATLEEVPDGPMILIANEFFDALPVHQYLRAADGWRERLVGLRGGDLYWGLSPPLPDQAWAKIGSWRETSPLGDAVLDQISKRLRKSAGAALVVDYGYRRADRPRGPTLQAVKGHDHVDPLAEPGEADLTWLLDFDVLGARLGRRTKLSDQGAFLASLGIGQRAQQLAERHPEQADALADALERLTGRDQMGRLFKVASVISGGPGHADPEVP